ncbi:unnamed protein product [Leptidea sinapis]|uniref:Uncharacterized protein n=1 Tax=Leptidea sinapis TaxID=189913 RepID=A0A5E4QKB6_9NEOP|nr:unnamed protein product [Leptidea sinapis]
MASFDILKRATKRSQKILKVALRSGYLKSGYVRDLKVAAKDLEDMVEILTLRTPADESK